MPAGANSWRDPISTNKLGVMPHTWDSSYEGVIVRKIPVWDWPWEKSWDPIQKIKPKRIEGVAQVVEQLPSKHEVLNSNDNPALSKNKKKNFGILEVPG
jgi:hypothetical protein